MQSDVACLHHDCEDLELLIICVVLRQLVSEFIGVVILRCVSGGTRFFVTILFFFFVVVPTFAVVVAIGVIFFWLYGECCVWLQRSRL